MLIWFNLWRPSMIDDFETILTELKKCHLRWPLLRFGQLLQNITGDDNDIYYLSEDCLIEDIKTYLENN